MAYNVNVSPVNNMTATGQNVGQISAPPSIYDELNQNVPNYGALTTTATGDIQSKLNGGLSPGTINLLTQQAAERGVSGGLGVGSGFTTNNLLESLGLSSEAQTQQGLTDYNQFAQTQGSQQQNPALLTDVATQNALDAAAPNPMLAQSYAQQLFDQYLNGSGTIGKGKTQTQAGKLGLSDNGIYHQAGGSGPYIPGEV